MNAGDFQKFSFEAPLTTGQAASHDVYFAGFGPAILLIQELPGIDQDTFGLAEKLIDQGYSVYLPLLIGRFGEKAMLANTARLFCVRREINMFARGKQSPISTWLRGLCGEVETRAANGKIGVIGMCLSGGFALALMADDAVLGAVASQPSLPMFGGSALDMTADDIVECKAAMKAKGGALAMRYANDPIARRKTMQAIDKAFTPHIKTVEFEGSKHSLLTGDFNQGAYDEMSAYFKMRFAS
ncbi:MAG: dienelactone hydrolase family protein [Amylibacter sp.]|nr:dienelactone hydrolase family protein [Amylibacter sp.]